MVFTKAERNRVQAQNVIEDQNRVLLEILERKPPEAFAKYFDALEKSAQGHLATKIRNTIP